MTTTDELFTAISAGDAGLLDRLLDADPDLAVAPRHGLSPVRAAALWGHPELAESLRQRGIALDVFDAATIGDVDRLRELLDDEPDRATAHTDDGYTALHLAAWSGQPKVVELLLARGADPRAMAQDASGIRPLNSAAAGGDQVIVHLLLDRGADVDDAQERGITPLHVAAGRNDVKLVALLLGRGADPSLRTVAGRTAADFTADPSILALLP